MAASGFVSSLVAAGDERLLADRLLSAAVAHWHGSPRRKTCFCCGITFFTETTPAAYLLVRAAHSATVATAALCEPCWSTASEADILAEATRALRPVLAAHRHEARRICRCRAEVACHFVGAR